LVTCLVSLETLQISCGMSLHIQSTGFNLTSLKLSMLGTNPSPATESYNDAIGMKFQISTVDGMEFAGPLRSRRRFGRPQPTIVASILLRAPIVFTVAPQCIDAY
jgi:hypothetical protein